jgi:N-carbamoyl-L-amino-acid hydrolase
MEMARIGALPNGGVKRLAASDEDKMGRDLFVTWCTELGFGVRYDEMGSIFAEMKGTRPDLPAILTGSHLDTQPTGGKYDGSIGVIAALEVAQVIKENNIQHERTIDIVSWTNEEGARFSPAMVASGVFAGVFTLDYGLSRTDSHGLTLGDELQRIGYKGTLPAAYSRKVKDLQPIQSINSTGENVTSYDAFIELHIEQGPILESAGETVGVVTGVQGMCWYDIEIVGSETHAGPTPMNLRNDPIRKLGNLIPQIYALAQNAGEDARATIGELQAYPGSRNTVPGKVRFTVDLRHPDKIKLHHMSQTLNQLCVQIGAVCNEVWNSSPVHFDSKCVGILVDSCKKRAFPFRKLVSGAGHDAVYVSKVIPTAMIFIPCKNGISHNEAEYATPQDIVNGTTVLLDTICELANPKT